MSKESRSNKPVEVVLTRHDEIRLRKIFAKRTAVEIRVPELGPCLIWKGAKFKQGYGKMTFHKCHRKAHRLAMLLVNGPKGKHRSHDD